MSTGQLGSRIVAELTDLQLGIWEARHSLFAHYALYGAVLVALGLVAAPLARRAREWVVVALGVASVMLLGSFTVGLAALVYSLCLWSTVEYVPGRGGTALAGLLVVALAAYPTLLPGDVFAGNTSHMREFWSFATNVWWLRCIAYVVDRRSRGTPRRTLREFLLATLFFPTFINGPIETTEQLDAHRRRGPAVDSWAELRDWLRLLVRSAGRFFWGSAKVLIGVFYLAQENETIFATGGLGVSHPRLWLWIVELYFTFYIVFSGWTDVALAFARPLGFDVMENFDRPWRSRSVAEFWRRWHVSFGLWLRNYVYVPLGGNRRHAELNVLLTFLASGLWHVWGALKVLGIEAYPPSAWIGFVVWGLMNGVAVIAGRWWANARALAPMRDGLATTLPSALRLRAAQGMAFAFVALAWVPFFLPPWVDVSQCWRILLRVLFVT
ncbi:MAG: MBOAT family O-acyltransferase [Thermodesulfobacteriota bacterium]